MLYGMTEDYIARAGQAHLARRREKRATLTTPQALRYWQTEIRALCAEFLGPPPRPARSI